MGATALGTQPAAAASGSFTGNPAVTATAYDSLGLARNTRTVSYNEDARQFLVTLDPARKYNYIHGDAFNDFSVPYHLTTREFNELVKRHLTPNGIYLSNVIDGRDLPFARALLRTLKATFTHVYFIPSNKAYRDIRANTMLVLATNSPLDTPATTTRASSAPGSSTTPNSTPGWGQARSSCSPMIMCRPTTC